LLGDWVRLRPKITSEFAEREFVGYGRTCYVVMVPRYIYILGDDSTSAVIIQF